MKGKSLGIFLFLFLAAGLIYGLVLDEAQSGREQNARNIIKQNCSVSGCHMGKYPQMGLNLESGKFPQTVVDVPSTERPSLKIIDSQNPEKSYLLMKIKGSPEIVGKQMPMSRTPLSSENIRTIQDWIEGIKGGRRPQPRLPRPSPSARPLRRSRKLPFRSPRVRSRSPSIPT